VATLKNGVTLGVCGPRSNGQPCSEAADCQSAACVDGVCCESMCQGGCRSCNLAGSPGRCLNVAAGASDPRYICQDLGVSACSTNGACDGKGGCQTYPTETPCGSQTCVNGIYNPPPTCNAIGQCVASRVQPCSPYACNGDTCFGACSTSAECALGATCTNGSCGLKPRGATCAAGRECSTGFCAQGVCCDSACTVACMACNLMLFAGTCTPVIDGVPDPQGKCKATDPALCGTTGTCRKGACAYYDAGLNCSAAVCATTNSVTPASTCDGSGACRTPTAQPCGNFACMDGACKSSCTEATQAQDCIPPNTCVSYSCGLKLNGTACTEARQCSSGICTEGVCCNAPCTESCKTCKPPVGAAGTCVFVEAGADPKDGCKPTSVATGNCRNGGTCNGSGLCQPWPAGTVCGEEKCTDDGDIHTHTLAPACNAAGDCIPANPLSCGDYVCSEDHRTCLDSCTKDGDCSGGKICYPSGQCGKKKAPGDPCSRTDECASGVCSAEGVCCDLVCDGICESCKVADHLGECLPNLGASCTPSPSSPCPGPNTRYTGAGFCNEARTCSAVVESCPQDYECNAESGECEPPAIDAGG
jgi:hypothetical protein